MTPRRVLGRLTGAALRAASRRSLLALRGTGRLRGLAGPVDVRYDELGVPHVSALGDADALTAVGVCHAIDRFFQMDVMRRALSGRLAETVGERKIGAGHPLLGPESTTVDADRLMRQLDLVGAARRTVAAAPPEDRALLDAYVRGVNEALALLRRRRPLEHRLLGLGLAPWRPVDSVLIAKGLALNLSFKWRTAPVLQGIADLLGARPRLLEAILPPCPQAGDLALARMVRRGVDQALAFLPNAVPLAGSNAFVVGGGRSASGFPVLASDPHLELSLPSVWYLLSVRAGRYAAVGCSLPGLPGVVIGRTPGVAWGLTNGMIDDGDLWLEEVDGPGSRYRVDGRWRPLAVETQEIKRRGKAPLLMRLRRTHRGPLFTDAFVNWPGRPLSLRMTLYEPAADLQAFLAMGRARDVDGVCEATRTFGAPAQNLLVADTSGRAAYRLMGRVPERAPHPVHPGLYRDGTTTKTDWTGWIDRSRLPAFEIGPDDAVVSANEPHLAEDDAPYLSHLYEPPYRASRLRECFLGRTDLTADDLAGFQVDVRSAAVRWFRMHVLLPHADAVRRMRPHLGRLVDLLLTWDGEEAPEAVGPALWHLTHHHLLRRTFGPVLGAALLDRWLGLVNMMEAPLRRAFEDEDSPWAPPAARVALLQSALEDAEKDLHARGLPVGAPWSALHRLTLRHPLSSLPGVGDAFTRGPFGLRGSPFAPASGQYAHTHPAAVTGGASYRHVCDLGDLEGGSRMITFGGQSGHVGSPHYDDLTPLWLANEGLPMRLEEPPPNSRLLRLLPG